MEDKAWFIYLLCILPLHNIEICGHCLATIVFIGKLPATRGVWVINDERGHGPTKKKW